ncbi:MAG: hypothetical protein HY303_03610 [Candidatus Wallbacteria bacterium]|nr:hypothetical protein [Candidatus Wallbacteria bacterium]
MDTVLAVRERLLHWLAFVLTAAAALLAASGCAEGLLNEQPREATFGTERTLVFKVLR